MAKKLLIIDDEAGISQAVGSIAAELGMTFKTITRPHAAAREFIDYRPDVVLLDMIMPDKDGIEILTELLGTGIEARIVLTSGFGDSYLRLAEGVAKFHNAPGMTVLKKPFRRNEVIAMLNDLTGP